MPNKTVREIVEGWLKENGYDGLFNDDGNCACLIGDTGPCYQDCLGCKAGYKVPCDGYCDFGECDFHVSSEKEKKE